MVEPVGAGRAHGGRAGRDDNRDNRDGRDDVSARDLRERLGALVGGHGRRCRADGVWLYLFDAAMPAYEHGWKLHLSARPEDLAATVELVVPVLLRYTCDAKFAVSAAVLREVNSGAGDPHVVGKAVTVYPRARDLVALAGELAEVLAGRPGPRVLSDRRVRQDSPVYYRYGPFRVSGPGAAALVMTGPDGQGLAGRASARYRQPPWAADPFGRPAPGAGRASHRVGGRFRLTAGIARSPHGDVYRGVDETTGDRVVVKQARAHTGADDDGVDACGRLRHEHGVLAALDGVHGVPRLLDHLRHGEDEFLVMTDCGPADLRREVLERGPYRWRSGRDVTALAHRLLTVLDAVHARGVVVCDLKPGNVVLDADGAGHVVDFGISALGGSRPAGATRGYSLPVYRAGRAPEPADDLYALGATLHYALTGMDPVVVDPDPAVNRARTLACLAAALPGAARRPLRRLVAALLLPDPGERTAAAHRFRSGGPALPGPAARSGGGRVPSPPRISAGLLDEVIAHTVATCVRAVPGLLAAPGPHPPGSSLTLYAGAAGVGLELLRHLDRPGVPRAVTELARRTLDHPELPLLGAGLYTGRTGVDVFLRSAAALLGAPAPRPCAPPAYDTTGDQIGGAAGVGTGHLVMARQAYEAGRTEEARHHLSVAGACADALPAPAPADAADPRSGRPASSSDAAYEDGFAHGAAGIVHFLHAHHRLSGDPAVGAAARGALARLAARTPGLLAAAGRPEASRRYGSWCRGLAGVGTVLVETGVREEDADLLALGVRCARACHRLAPGMSLVSQCCGLSGVGELLVDAAYATGDDRLWDAAEEVAGLILARSGGTARRPLFPDHTLAGTGVAWATGGAGVLSFVRRLRARGGTRLCTPA
ncbi:class IV lanthionine synthetase LanL [Streptomyces subrutilus]|uniref:class IV lanthionine synthetase LanL n=1 Tax=Streptomyces subrutilus TaxID=36818 RepID=UPI002E149C03|nr:class IV lanthionine synthetase LanL [Streptomyces subrutilus]